MIDQTPALEALMKKNEELEKKLSRLEFKHQRALDTLQSSVEHLSTLIRFLVAP